MKRRKASLTVALIGMLILFSFQDADAANRNFPLATIPVETMEPIIVDPTPIPILIDAIRIGKKLPPRKIEPVLDLEPINDVVTPRPIAIQLTDPVEPIAIQKPPKRKPTAVSIDGPPVSIEVGNPQYNLQQVADLIDYMFNGGGVPDFDADFDGNGVINIVDLANIIDHVSNGENDLQDLGALIDYVFRGGEIPDFDADFNGDGEINIVDIVHLIDELHGDVPTPDEIGEPESETLASRRAVMKKKNIKPADEFRPPEVVRNPFRLK